MGRYRARELGVQQVSCPCLCRMVPYCAIENGEIIMMDVWTSDFPSGNRFFSREKANLPAEGLEPTRSCDHWILSPARLPFRHAGAFGNGAKEYELPAEAQTFPTRSSGCKLRGGPKISRKIIASRKSDVDLSSVATLILVSAGLEIVCRAVG